MKIQQFLNGLFVSSFIFIFVFFPFSPGISGVFAILSAAFLAARLARFLDTAKRKSKRGIRIEEVTFGHSFIFRSFFKPKDIWVVYDKKEKKFRPADFREMPLEVGFFLIFGLFLLYTSYLMMSTMFDLAALIPIRATILVILSVMGFYIFSVSIGRVVALLSGKNREAAKMLNKNAKLRGFAKRTNARIEVTPSFNMLGFVTSVEIKTKHKYDTAKEEQLLLDVSLDLNKYK
ncbi:MAG: hypothetical protein JW700_02415 [Candidatus Aenigmarchaeota archaeon]|nr:hypothetical protein [Candidatus Aenigmarchaeota archaeon]